MGTSTIPYDIRLWMFPGANPSADSSLWGLPWDVSAKIRHSGSDGGQEISYQSGRMNEGGQVDPGACSLSLDNRLGWFSTQNAAGPKYGLISKNTPAILGMVTGYDTFTRTAAVPGTSDSGQAWSATKAFWSTDGSRLVASGIATPNDASLLTLAGSGASDFDIVFTATPTAAITGDFYTIAALQNGTTGYLLFSAEFKPGNVLTATIRRIGTSAGSASVASTTAPFSWTINQAVTVRSRRVGASVMMKVWRPAVESEPAAWTAIGTEAYVGNGGDLGLFVWRSGINTNATYTMYVDDLTIIGFEVIGTVVQWPTNWDRTGNNSWAPIQIAGVLRRLQQGKGPLKSPLYRQLPAYSPTGYWPLEEEASATRFGSAVAGGVAASFQGVTPAGDSSLPGGASAPTLSDTAGFIRGTTSKKLSPSVATTGFAAMIFTKLASIPATKTAMFTWTTTGSPSMPVRWVTSISTGGTWVEGFDSDGNLVTSASNALATGMDFTGWVAWQLELSLSAGTTSWASIYHGVGLSDYNSQTGSFGASVFSQCTGFVAGSSNLPTGTAFAHVWIGANTLPFVTNTFSLVSSGYLGETAGARIARLCGEEGIPCVVEPGATVALGVQPQSNTLAALRLAADTDLGVLYERGSGLGYRPLSARYQQAVSFTLSKASGHIADVPAPIDDDQRYRNQWTVSRDGGSFAFARAPQSEIDLNGLYDDSATVSLPDDSTLDDHAGFRLFLSRQASFRWPDIGINLSRNPSLVSTWRTRAYGPRVRATLSLLQMTGADPDVIAEGFVARLTPLWWSVSMSCSDARPFDITTLDDSINERLDADNSTVNAAFLTGATSFVVNNNGDPYSSWATTAIWPAEVPFFIKVSGEIMTVTNVGAVAGNVQTLTVTRGVNGFTKDHAAGEQVSLAYPTYVAL